MGFVEWLLENIVIVCAVLAIVAVFVIVWLILGLVAYRKKGRLGDGYIADSQKSSDRAVSEQPAEAEGAAKAEKAQVGQAAEGVETAEANAAPQEDVAGTERAQGNNFTLSSSSVSDNADVAEEEDEEPAVDFSDEEDEDEALSVLGGVKIVFRYQYSFMARLIQSSAEVQARYGAISDFVGSFKDVKTNISWKQERVYSGRKTYAMLLFKGKTLCLALALDPAEYVGSKYGITDLSEVKRFEKTPALLKITSDRKVKYATELLGAMFSSDGHVQGEVTAAFSPLPYKSTTQLVEEKLVKLLSNADRVRSSNLDRQLPVADMIMGKISLREAELILTDEVAKEVYKGSIGARTAGRMTVKGAQRAEINIDTLSQNFAAGEEVTLEKLKQKKLVPQKIKYIKVLARGVLDKPLTVAANDFSLNAIKMIVLTGGSVKQV